MKIQVGGLSEGLHTYHFEVPASELDLGETFDGPVSADVELEKRGHQVLLKAAVSTVGRFPCDRCVGPFERAIAGNYRMFYVQEGTDASGVDASELQTVPAGFTVIDIADDVRQTVLLSVPLKLLCRDDCRGLCPRCGRNLNDIQCGCAETPADPRWEKLRSLPRN